MRENKLSTSYLNAHPELRDKILREIENLFESTPPEHMRDTIDELFHMYVMSQHTHGFPVKFDSMGLHIFLLKSMLRKIQMLMADDELK